ncbi:MAG TPA: TonB-dependent receptor [Lentimicrobium sp.]|nr:TonB-dependent receptor [Lentimicrobium sp.]
MHFLRKSLLSVIALLTVAVSLNAQDAVVRGFVYEKETGEPVIFTNVYLYKTTYGAATDVNGYFTISKIPEGTYTLMVTYLGFDTIHEQVTLKKGQVITKKLYMSKSSVNLKEFEVTAEHAEAKTDTRTSVITITPKQISRIPTIGGQPDLAQYLQVLPGIVFTGDQGGQLYIRGGSPIQNKVILDGMVIYNPFHSIGLFSVFDTDILRNADIFTGGFNSEYGGRISSVMDLTTKDGNKKKISGKAGLSTFGGKLMLEGPIAKQKEDGNGSVSFILTAKNSYLKESSKIFYNYIDTAGLPFNYTDLYGKISINASNGSKINVYGFNFNDKVDYTDMASYNWESSGAGANFVVIPGNNPVLLEGNVAFSSYDISMLEAAQSPRTSKINGFNLGLGFTYFLGKNEIKYGLEMLGFKTVLDFFNSVGLGIDLTENTTEIAGFVKYKMTKGKFLFEPGFRLQYYASLSNISPEPRVAMKYNITDHLRFKMAAGLYSQNLLSSSSDRDVVNLFYGFLSGSDDLQEEFKGKKVTHKLQKAEHVVAGFEIDPFPYATINLEAYYKNFSQLTNMNRNKVFPDNPPYSTPNSPNYVPDFYRKDFIIEEGNANGIDLSLKYDRKSIYFWAVYSLAYVNRSNEYEEYVPHYDRRHNVNLVTSYRFGDEYSWEINARWNLGSGFPFTQNQGIYEKVNFNDGIYSDIISIDGEMAFVYGKYNGARLSYYHRLDLSLMKRFNIGENGLLEANISVTNVYDRSNIFYVNRITGDKIYQLPIMPSAGLTFSF